MKKRILSIVLILIMTVMCAACGSGNGGASENGSNVIKVGWYTAWYLPEDYYDQLFEDFAAMYPEYTIEKVAVNSVSELIAQVQ